MTVADTFDPLAAAGDAIRAAFEEKDQRITFLEAQLAEVKGALGQAKEAIRELRLADGHAARTGDETRFDRALSNVCQHENRLRAILSAEGREGSASPQHEV